MKKFYFKKFWNNFDLILCCLTVVSIILNYSYNFSIQKQQDSGIGIMIDIFQVLRVIRIIKVSKKLTKLMGNIGHVLPQVFPLLVLLVLILFIYTIVGINLFPYIKAQNYLNDFD